MEKICGKIWKNVREKWLEKCVGKMCKQMDGKNEWEK